LTSQDGKVTIQQVSDRLKSDYNLLKAAGLDAPSTSHPYTASAGKSKKRGKSSENHDPTAKKQRSKEKGTCSSPGCNNSHGTNDCWFAHPENAPSWWDKKKAKKRAEKAKTVNRSDNRKKVEVYIASRPLAALAAITEKSAIFADSGASDSMFIDKNRFENYKCNGASSRARTRL
jgi:hypothetical protein